MDPSPIRSRLAGADGRLYWRSLGELADTPEFREYLHREFPEQASEWNDPKGRREFLKLMSASFALAGVGACTRQPPEAIVPYVRQPEQIVPGRPLYFATAVPLSGVAQPVLVESHMGRPTKIEGNPEHPASLGATDTLTQAAVLDLYDPDRARTVTDRGQVTSWNAFSLALQMPLAAAKSAQGTGFHLLTGPVTSPSQAELIASILQDYPQARWHQYDPVARPVPGQVDREAGLALYHFEKADVVVSLDADFLACGPASVRYTRDFTNRRRVTDEQKTMNRLYAVESTPTLTGARADHRLPVRASDVESFAAALAAAVGVAAGSGAAASPAPAGADELQKWIAAVAADLQAHRARSLVVAGDSQPPSVHAMAQAMNQTLGNVGATVSYTAPVEARPVDYTASLVELTTAMDAGQVRLLVILGGNPAYAAPADLKFAERLRKVPLAIYHGLYADETAFLCHWHVPDVHPLETWGDARAYDGTVTIMQPLIAPLYEGRSAHEFLTLFTAQPGRRALDIVKDYWTRAFGGQGGWTIRGADGQPFGSAEAFWTRAVHDGFVAGTALTEGGPPTPFAPAAPAGVGATEPAGAAAAASAAGAAVPAPSAPDAAGAQPAPVQTAQPGAAPEGGLELIFRPDPTIWDGRFANNGWLQELPKPLTKLTWDTAAWVSPALASERQLRDGDVVELRYRGNTTRMPVMVVPGQPHRSVTVFFGYGRERAGRVGTAGDESRAFNAFLLRTSDAPWFGQGLELVRTGERYLLATTQEHHLMEGRNTVRVATLAQYSQEPSIIHHMGHTPPRTLTLYPEHEYEGYKWGMAIDVTTCTGCSACVVACVAENNIPVVGKEQVSRNREMHWLRVDSYFSAESDDLEALENPQIYFQPLPCMQCETAPCEVVCPVAATTHSSEGLNDMVYNRCVGTRYCSNNCPYKVRRFNFLLYSDWTTPSLEPLRNPDVTVRSRGVMEKCTYCVQRINQARIDAKREERTIRDGEILTACQSVCPAQAIVFGDLNDPSSEVSKLKAQQRNYGLLEDLNTRPRTTYLAALRNPNPELEPAGTRPAATGH
ncbi:MAG TPA: TAT-variant-translocated molybdopterin oxidoreductase [Vicinamibacterales bacterium]|nr:TAT-variant-translocated molybdopterin oxidoreductase [Vicinamibacterales bacterium]